MSWFLMPIIYTLLDNIVVDSSLDCIEIVNTSPNGDGINDYWNLNSLIIPGKLIIFNKWGIK